MRNRMNAGTTLDKNILNLAKRKKVSVEKITNEMSTSLGYKKEKIAKNLYILLENGKIELVDLNPPRNLLQYSLSSYSLWFWTLIGLFGLTAISIYIFPNKIPFLYLRYIFGSIFTLYLPGYSLLETLYPTKEKFTILERTAFSIGLSLALVPLIGLSLNYTPWGISLNTVYISLSLLTVLFSFTALSRKFSYLKLKKIPPEQIKTDYKKRNHK